MYSRKKKTAVISGNEAWVLLLHDRKNYGMLLFDGPTPVRSKKSEISKDFD